MPLFLKPHTVARWKASENVSGSTFEVRGVYYDSPVEIRGQLTPMASSAAFEASGVEIRRPHEWFWDTSDDFEVNDLVKFGDRYFVVANPQEIWNAEPITAHRKVILEEIDAFPASDAQGI